MVLPDNLPAQVRSFCFTRNLKDDEDYDPVMGEIEYKLREIGYKYLIMGREVAPTTGKRHIQGFCQLEKRITLRKIGGMFPWNATPRYEFSTNENAAIYCMKSGSFLEFGSLKSEKDGGETTKNIWREIVDLAKSGSFPLIEEKYPGVYLRCLRNLHMVRVEAIVPSDGEVKCLYLWGKPGTGKSRFAFDYDPNGYPKMCNKWWDGYRGQKTIIMDDFSKNHHVLCDLLKRWADRYRCIFESKGSVLHNEYDTFILTSNYHPDTIWPDDEEAAAAIKRRFKIIHVLGHEVSGEGIINLKVSYLTTYKLINKFNIWDDEEN